MTRRRGSDLFVACLALGALLSADWIAVFHPDDDPGCGTESVVPVEATRAGRLSPQTGGDAPQHCLVCHWLRSLRSLAAGALSVAMTMAPLGAVRWVPVTRTRHSPLFHVPARAPPA